MKLKPNLSAWLKRIYIAMRSIENEVAEASSDEELDDVDESDRLPPDVPNPVAGLIPSSSRAS